MLCGERILIPSSLPFSNKYLEMRVFQGLVPNIGTAILFRLLELSLEKPNFSLNSNPACTAITNITKETAERVNHIQSAMRSEDKSGMAEVFEFVSTCGAMLKENFHLHGNDIQSLEAICEAGEFKIDSPMYGCIGKANYKLEVCFTLYKSSLFLLYKVMTFESFVDFPACGHFGVKYAYLKELRDRAGGRAVSKDEIGVINCQECGGDVTEIVVNEVVLQERGMRPEEGYQLRTCDRCKSECKNQKSLSVCGKHRVCENCTVKNLLTCDFIFSPCCFQVIPLVKILDIIDMLESRTYLKIFMQKAAHFSTFQFYRGLKQGNLYEGNEIFVKAIGCCPHCWKLIEGCSDPCACQSFISLPVQRILSSKPSQRKESYPLEPSLLLPKDSHEKKEMEMFPSPIIAQTKDLTEIAKEEMKQETPDARKAEPSVIKSEMAMKPPTQEIKQFTDGRPYSTPSETANRLKGPQSQPTLQKPKKQLLQCKAPEKGETSHTSKQTKAGVASSEHLHLAFPQSRAAKPITPESVSASSKPCLPPDSVLRQLLEPQLAGAISEHKDCPVSERENPYDPANYQLSSDDEQRDPPIPIDPEDFRVGVGEEVKRSGTSQQVRGDSREEKKRCCARQPGAKGTQKITCKTCKARFVPNSMLCERFCQCDLCTAQSALLKPSICMQCHAPLNCAAYFNERYFVCKHCNLVLERSKEVFSKHCLRCVKYNAHKGSPTVRCVHCKRELWIGEDQMQEIQQAERNKPKIACCEPGEEVAEQYKFCREHSVCIRHRDVLKICRICGNKRPTGPWIKTSS